MSMIFLGFLSQLPRKHLARVILTRFHIYSFQIYNWVGLILSLHLSSVIFASDLCTNICKILDIANILLTIGIANFIEYARININFKCEDFLDSRVDLTDRILLNFKIFVIMAAGLQFYIDYLVILLFVLLCIDYFRKINFYIEKISQIYLSCLFCFLFCELIYFSFYHGFINLESVDVSYLLFFGCSFLLKTAIHLRGFLVIHKLKRIAKIGIRNKLDFDLYIRETYANLHNFTTDLEAKILFLSFFSLHQNRCRSNECVCKTVSISNQTNYLRNKKTFKRVVEIYFIDYLSKVTDEDYEEAFLMYCSFITNILKNPSKALKLLIVSRHKMISLKNRILVEILIKKSKKSLEKKLLNNDQYSQSFSTVIFFDYQIKTLENSLRHIILSELKIGSILLDSIESASKAFDSFVTIGNEVNKSIEASKEQAKKLFDLNVNNTRLIQLTILIIKYLSEDTSFRNFYKQLNIKRINQDILKRKNKNLASINIFDNDAGVIFLSLGKEIGVIKKFSKNIPKIFKCDSHEMKNENISRFMPLIFKLTHDIVLKNFVNTGKANLLISGLTQLFGITKENILLHLNLIIRLDTFFSKDFMIGGFIKTMKNSINKTILIDIHGNFINCSKELANFLNFTNISPSLQHEVSMLLLIPDIIEKILPYNFDDLLLKSNTDFKMKGFLLAPVNIDERNIRNISIKDRIYASFQEFEKLENSKLFYQNLRNEVFNKIINLVAQEFKFYRIHFTLIIQNFRSNLVNIRLIEIYDILEITDLKLQIQYLSKKSKNLRNMLKNEFIPEEKLDKNSISPLAQRNPFPQQEIKINEASNGNLPFQNEERYHNEKEYEKAGFDSFISISNRSNLENKVKGLNESKSEISHKPFIEDDIILLKNPEINSDYEENKPLKSEEASSEHQLLIEKHHTKGLSIAKSVSTIQEASELTYDKDEDFDEKISQMSNELQNNESEEAETLEIEKTNTRGGSQASRISSHASGDGKKSTLDSMVKLGAGKIQYLNFLMMFMLFSFVIVTTIFFVLIRNETYNLEITLKNSGIFHNQLAPLCLLVRDSIIFKLLYSGLLSLPTAKKTEMMNEINSSLPFNNFLLLKAYKTGIAKIDSSLDFVYTKFVNVTLQNVTLYTSLLKSSNSDYILHEVPVKYADDNIIYASMNLPQCFLFFLSASEHLYYSNILQDVENARDSYNYIFFLQENILVFIKSMIEVLEINKDKIGGSVNYLATINLAFFLIIFFAVIYTLVHLSYISIKSKFKANKFCSLFFFFQEKEIDDRSDKLRSVLDRYFNTKNIFLSTNISSLSKSNSSKRFNGIDMLSNDKIQFMKSENQSKTNKMHRHHHGKKGYSFNQVSGRKFKFFLLIFFFGVLSISISIIGLYLSNYVSVNSFSANVIEITGDIESIESYVLTLHVQYAVSSIFLGLYDETSERKNERIVESIDLLKDVMAIQNQITDMATLFKVSNTDHILTQLKYNFFTKNICELISNIKENVQDQESDIREIADRLKNIDFCRNLLKTVLTKGATSFALKINEIFQQWQNFIGSKNFSSEDVIKIVQTDDYMDIIYALPYIYALGMYDVSMMMIVSENYFEAVRNNMLAWFIVTLIIVSLFLSAPFQKIIKHLNEHWESCFSLIKIFPYVMISKNKMLENKISRIGRQQKI